MIDRLGRIQIRNAARAGNAATFALLALRVAGIHPAVPLPLPAPTGIVETAALWLIVVWLRWQASLSRQLLRAPL